MVYTVCSIKSRAPEDVCNCNCYKVSCFLSQNNSIHITFQHDVAPDDVRKD